MVDCRDAVAEFERKLAKGADVEKGRKRGREVEVEQEKEGKRKRGGATTSRGGKARR